jgi:hypothetical protein
MGLETVADGADRFMAFVEELTSVIGHADRAVPLRDYCIGLLAAEGRKSVEPMAAVTAPSRVSAQHQKLLHFIGEGKWSDESVLAKVRELVGWPDSAARPRAGRRVAPSVHSLVRSKSGRDHSGCRQKPELGSARTETAGQSSPLPATAHVDAIGNDWNTAPACVLSTV